MGKLIHTLLTAGLILAAHAQPNVKLVTKVSSNGQPNVELPLAKKPSRLVKPEEVKEYIGIIATSFQLKAQGFDPFGNNQDLTIIPPPVKATSDEVAAVPNKVALAEIVKRLGISMIFQGEKKIVIGSVPYKQGEQIPVKIGGKLIPLQFTKITAEQLTFRNAATGETATRDLNKMPAGMNRSNNQTTPEGMSPANSSTPIELGSDESAP